MKKINYGKTKIEEVKEYKDFEKVYRVFEGEPYNEIYTENEIRDLYNMYNKQGKIFGFYVGDNCAGIVAYEKNPEGKYPVKYDENVNVAYLADIAVLNEYRNTGIGTSLMLYALFDAKKDGFNKMFMRTLEKEKSMSYGIAKSVGYKEIENVKQVVTRERNEENKNPSENNIFLDIDLKKDLDKDKARKIMDRLIYNKISIEKSKKEEGELR